MTAVSWVKTRGIALLFFLSTRMTASGFDEEGSPNCHFEIRLVSPIAPMSSAEAKPERLEPEKLLYFWLWPGFLKFEHCHHRLAKMDLRTTGIGIRQCNGCKGNVVQYENR